MNHLELLLTGDGSYTLVNKYLGESYHSRHGALTESRHVFINEGLTKIRVNPSEIIHILEVGLGTGLNAWLTAMEAENKQQKIIYTALEPNPPGSEFCIPPNDFSEKDYFIYNLIHTSDWGKPIIISDYFEFIKLETGVEFYQSPPEYFDLIYYDAFAPNYQPEMWSTEVFRKIFDWMKPDSMLVTYCAKGIVKRNLKECGFQIENPPGPPGKREMTVAKKYCGMHQ